MVLQHLAYAIVMLMKTATGEILSNTTSFPFKLKGSVTTRADVARFGDEYVFRLEPDLSQKIVQIKADELQAKIDETQAEYNECSFWQQIKMTMRGRWFAEEVDTSAGYIKVGCPARDTVQMNLPITLPVTEYPYDPLGKPKPHETSRQANILVASDALQKALRWCDLHQNERPAQPAAS